MQISQDSSGVAEAAITIALCILDTINNTIELNSKGVIWIRSTLSLNC